MSWNDSRLRAGFVFFGCFFAVSSLGMVFVDDEFYGNRDVPGPAGASLAFMLALGTVCFVVAFKDQIAACCRSSGGSLLLPSGRTYKNSDGSVVASHKSIEAAKKLALADKRPGPPH